MEHENKTKKYYSTKQVSSADMYKYTFPPSFSNKTIKRNQKNPTWKKEDNFELKEAEV